MKVEMSPRLYAHRGGPVEVGNVYSNDHARHFKVVIAIATTRNGRTPWNNIVCIHIDATGDVVGCSCQPRHYMSQHQDLIGRVTEMPSMKIKWFKEEQANERHHKLRKPNRRRAQ